MKIYSFPSISDKNARILILGSMPGNRSLELNQYYGHNRNAFWKLIFALFGENFSDDYENRKYILLKNKVALWDVLQACERQGSLDSAIQKEVANDFTGFLSANPEIKYILFNGQTAAKFFRKYVTVPDKYKLIILPSTSPAHSGLSFDKKLKAWEIINEL